MDRRCETVWWLLAETIHVLWPYRLLATQQLVDGPIKPQSKDILICHICTRPYILHIFLNWRQTVVVYPQTLTLLRDNFHCSCHLRHTDLYHSEIYTWRGWSLSYPWSVQPLCDAVSRLNSVCRCLAAAKWLETSIPTAWMHVFLQQRGKEVWVYTHVMLNIFNIRSFSFSQDFLRVFPSRHVYWQKNKKWTIIRFSGA